MLVVRKQKKTEKSYATAGEGFVESTPNLISAQKVRLISAAIRRMTAPSTRVSISGLCLESSYGSEVSKR